MSRFILENVQVILGSIGGIGNMLAFLVFLRKPLRNHSYAFYFRVLAWTDSLLIVNLFRHWSRRVLDFDIDSIGPLFCRFNEYHFQVMGSTSIWLRTLILFDRFIRIVYPSHFSVIKRNWFQNTSVLVLLVFSVILHIVVPLNSRLVEIKIENSNNSIYQLKCHSPPNIQELNFKLIMLNVISCSLLTILLDLKLITFIIRSKSRLRNRLYKPHSSVVKDLKFAFSSIAMCLNNFFCQIFFAICILTALILRLNIVERENLFIVSLTAAIFNSSSVFFINILINSIFYSEFLALFRTKFQAK